MREESLRFRDLHLIRTALPDAFVVRRDRVLQGCGACLYGLEGLDEAVRGVECVVGTLATV